jgi:hypothetical protein
MLFGNRKQFAARQPIDRVLNRTLGGADRFRQFAIAHLNRIGMPLLFFR